MKKIAIVLGVSAALAAGAADESRLNVGQPDIIRPAVIGPADADMAHDPVELIDS